MLVKLSNATAVIIFFMHPTIFYSCAASPASRAHEAHKVLPTLEVIEQRRLSNSALGGVAMLAGCAEPAQGFSLHPGMGNYHSNEGMRIPQNSVQNWTDLPPLCDTRRSQAVARDCIPTRSHRDGYDGTTRI